MDGTKCHNSGITLLFTKILQNFSQRLINTVVNRTKNKFLVVVDIGAGKQR